MLILALIVYTRLHYCTISHLQKNVILGGRTVCLKGKNQWEFYSFSERARRDENFFFLKKC